ncbi:hypothetical protein PPYR_10592 [Photinus pyralis]|uniref:Uncharacterized protein n=1 Tax=Photinus pyralis TaxID=7054 RepID=A0A1Y1JZ31_PHOPY|nr:uncharacterized protein LOC116174122 isoform X2 [Photinus pyralis]KAB0796531.1 hypothetical protein PPYR_10592 [Photinus pyralis]
MSLSSDMFISSFHSLTGVTIGERRKQLFSLLRQVDPSTRIDFSTLQPRCPLEESFKLDSLAYFRRLPELVEVLKGENPALIAKVLRLKWFVSALSTDLLELLPEVSFNVKVKLLNKLAVHLRDRRLADSLFRLVREKYSLNLALKLLPACSDGLILTYFASHYRQVFPKHLVIVLRERSELAEQIFEIMAGRGAFHCVFAYLTPVSLVNLYLKYKFSFRLGKRASRKVIEAQKDLLMANARGLRNFLHKKQSYKSLGNDFEIYYANLLPKNILHFPRAWPELTSGLGSLPAHRKLALIEKSFKRAYGSDIWSHSNCITSSLLAMAPLARRLSVRVKPAHFSEDNWVCYSSTDRSLPLLKEKISLTSDVSGRLALVGHLVETCKINDDTKALTEVCRFFLKQHRNDHVSIRVKFLTSLKDMFDLATLGKEHWVYIDELLQIFEMNHDSFPLAVDFLVKRIHYLLLNERPIDEYLIEYTRLTEDWCLFDYDTKFQKKCLLLIGRLLPQIFETSVLKYKQIVFLNNVLDWNSRNKTDSISIFDYPEAISAFTASLKSRSNHHALSKLIGYCLSVDSTRSLTNLCLQELRSCDWPILFRLLHLKIESVVENVEALTHLTLHKPIFAFWRHCRYYTHLDLPQRMVQVCRDLANEDSHAYTKRNAIVCLSHLMPPDDFLKELSKYYPTDHKAAHDQMAHYHNQRAFASCLRNVVPRSLGLRPALEFCQGDYLKIILSTLYSLSSNVNEHRLVTVLDELSSRTISVRKHAIHLTIRALDRSATLAMFHKFMANERNSSMRKFLLNGSFNLFRQDADDLMWTLVKANIEAVSREDKEVIDILLQFPNIPPRYIVEYTVFLWNYLCHSPIQSEYVERKQCELLRTLSKDVIQSLPKEFCDSLIRKYFTLFLREQRAKTLVCCVYNFASSYIIYCSDQSEQESRINMAISYLRQCSFQDESKYLINDFLKSVCAEFLLQRCSQIGILEKFSSMWGDAMAVDQYIYLKLTSLFVEKVLGLSVKDVGGRVAELAFNLCGKYGDCILIMMGDRLKAFHYNFIREGDSDINLYELIGGIIDGSKSSSIMILAIGLLKRNIADTATQCKHDEIVGKLKRMCDPTINIYLNRYLYGTNL